MKNNNEEKKLFMTIRVNDLLIALELPNLGELYQVGESNIWKKVQSKIKAHSAFLAMWIYGKTARA